MDVRFPSLKYNTHRRFCYVQFLSSAAAHSATELNGKKLGEKENLVVKISDPSKKQERSSAVTEGRELHVSNLDWKVTEDDLLELFLAYGNVETARIPTKVDGGSKGFGFVVFSTKSSAEAALAMDQKEFRSRPLRVRLASATGAKRQSTKIVSHIGQSKSPSVEPNGIAGSPPPSSTNASGDKQQRTIGLMNIPDTVNDARIQAIAEPYGQIIKVILRPDHQGAIVEYADIHAAGKASLSLEGHEIAPGRPIHVGTVPEMLNQTAEHKSDRIQIGKQREKSNLMTQPSVAIRRPGQPGNAGRGRRGGLGMKRAPPKSGESSSVQSNDKGNNRDVQEGVGAGEQSHHNNDTKVNDKTAGKSNDDFRAMLGQSKEEANKEIKGS